MVALEAMERARPVIASAVGGLPEIVADGETGSSCRPLMPRRSRRRSSRSRATFRVRPRWELPRAFVRSTEFTPGALR